MLRRRSSEGTLGGDASALDAVRPLRDGGVLQGPAGDEAPAGGRGGPGRTTAEDPLRGGSVLGVSCHRSLHSRPPRVGIKFRPSPLHAYIYNHPRRQAHPFQYQKALESSGEARDGELHPER